MEKASQKVTKDPRRVEQGKKSYETRMKRLKEKILEDNQLLTSSTSSSTCDLTPSKCDPTSSTSSSICDPTPSTSSHTTRSNDTYVYGVVYLSLPSVLVYFLHITLLKLKIKNKPMIALRLSSMSKKRINHQKEVLCFRSDDERNLYNKRVVLIGKKH